MECSHCKKKNAVYAYHQNVNFQKIRKSPLKQMSQTTTDASIN